MNKNIQETFTNYSRSLETDIDYDADSIREQEVETSAYNTHNMLRLLAIYAGHDGNHNSSIDALKIKEPDEAPGFCEVLNTIHSIKQTKMDVLATMLDLIGTYAYALF